MEDRGWPLNNGTNWIDRLRVVSMGPGYVVMIGRRVIGRYDRQASAELIVSRLIHEFRARNGGSR